MSLIINRILPFIINFVDSLTLLHHQTSANIILNDQIYDTHLAVHIKPPQEIDDNYDTLLDYQTYSNAYLILTFLIKRTVLNL